MLSRQMTQNPACRKVRPGTPLVLPGLPWPDVPVSGGRPGMRPGMELRMEEDTVRNNRSVSRHFDYILKQVSGALAQLGKLPFTALHVTTASYRTRKVSTYILSSQSPALSYADCRGYSHTGVAEAPR